MTAPDQRKTDLRLILAASARLLLSKMRIDAYEALREGGLSRFRVCRKTQTGQEFSGDIIIAGFRRGDMGAVDGRSEGVLG
ncbi:hypothetical protein [Microbacterium sp. No. 7]|uniref:hypothetical protein n=1 Tax=Microbacterium sp. No. 7 TaxID=1714373 RepID=UPI0012E2EB18|nr:hypothetical protein [Microbacterium sp. No. 7]